MPPGDVCLHVQPEPCTRFYGDNAPIMRMPNNADAGLSVFCCKHVAQKADIKSSEREVICHVVFKGGLSTINVGIFRSHSRGRDWGDKGPMHQTIKVNQGYLLGLHRRNKRLATHCHCHHHLHHHLQQRNLHLLFMKMKMMVVERLEHQIHQLKRVGGG